MLQQELTDEAAASEHQSILEVSPALQALQKALMVVETPVVFLELSTKVLAFNVAGKIQLQKRGRLLRRRLDQIFPNVPWARSLTLMASTRAVVSEIINIEIQRGLERKQMQLHCLFTPIFLSGTCYCVLHLLPARQSSAPVRPPESLLMRLRDPLTIIMGHLEMLIDSPGLEPRDMGTRLQKIARHAQQMANMINVPDV